MVNVTPFIHFIFESIVKLVKFIIFSKDIKFLTPILFFKTVWYLHS